MTTTEAASLLLSQPDSTECFAVPGVTMIDLIDSATGLTQIYKKSLDEVRAEGQKPWADYSKAERMTLEAYCQSKAEVQDAVFTWLPITEEQFHDALDALPPACYRGTGFLIGEPTDHHALSGLPRYTAYKEEKTAFYASSRPMTVTEFRAFMR